MCCDCVVIAAGLALRGWCILFGCKLPHGLPIQAPKGNSIRCGFWVVRLRQKLNSRSEQSKRHDEPVDDLDSYVLSFVLLVNLLLNLACHVRHDGTPVLIVIDSESYDFHVHFDMMSLTR